MITKTNKAGTVTVNLSDNSPSWEACTADNSLICEGTVIEGTVEVTWWQTTVAERTWRLEDEIVSLVVQAEVAALDAGC